MLSTYHFPVVFLATFIACLTIYWAFPRVMWAHLCFTHWWLSWLAFFTASTDTSDCGSSLPGAFCFWCSLTYLSWTFALSRIFSYSRSTYNSHMNFLTSKYLHQLNSKSLLILLSAAGSYWHFAKVFDILISTCSMVSFFLVKHEIYFSDIAQEDVGGWMDLANLFHTTAGSLLLVYLPKGFPSGQAFLY